MAIRPFLFALLGTVSTLAIATEPLKEIVVTPGNESRFDFSVVLSGRNGPRTMVVYAPDRTNGDCLPGLSIAELRSKDGQLIYSQSVELASGKKGVVVRTETSEPSNILTLWINYYCPDSHVVDGARYVFSSKDWEKSGRMQ